MARYSIDTSALLEGWRRNYPPDVFPALWSNLEKLIRSEDLIATEEVLLELQRKDDEVYQWARKQSEMFIPIDERVQLAVAAVLAKYPKLLDTRKGRSGADTFVIALAQIEGCTVVTAERATTSPDRPNIPDVCSVMKIRVISLLELIREQGWVFGS